MNIIELSERLVQLVVQGQGNKKIYVEGGWNGDETLEIDSVAKDTMPNIEANYYFLMPGGRVENIYD